MAQLSAKKLKFADDPQLTNTYSLRKQQRTIECPRKNTSISSRKILNVQITIHWGRNLQQNKTKSKSESSGLVA